MWRKSSTLLHIHEGDGRSGRSVGHRYGFLRGCLDVGGEQEQAHGGCGARSVHRARCYRLQRLREDLWNGRAWGRICPYCHSEDTELLRGRELEIRSIEAE